MLQRGFKQFMEMEFEDGPFFLGRINKNSYSGSLVFRKKKNYTITKASLRDVLYGNSDNLSLQSLKSRVLSHSRPYVPSQQAATDFVFPKI